MLGKSEVGVGFGNEIVVAIVVVEMLGKQKGREWIYMRTETNYSRKLLYTLPTGHADPTMIHLF